LKLINALMVTALVMFTAGVVHADGISGGDSRIILVPGDPPPDPSCSSFQAAAGADGTIAADCTVTGEIATSLTFAVPAADVLGGGLTCDSVLSDHLNWSAASSTGSVGGVSVDECTFTAPPEPDTTRGLVGYFLTRGGADAYIYSALHDDTPLFNPTADDGRCDDGDFLFGIPVGCDIGLNTPDGASIDNTEAFVAGALVDLSTSGDAGLAPFPEPGTLILMLLGLASLPFLRRRAIQVQR
jgi:hypothetical protein